MELKKITCLDGVYRWSCEPRESDGKKAFRITVRVVAGLCLALFLGAALFLRDEMAVRVTALCCAVAMLIGLGAGWLAMHFSQSYKMPYEMTEKEIRIGLGVNADRVRFRDILYAETAGNEIRLHTRFSVRCVSVPEEDLLRVADFILRRIDEEHSSLYR